MKTKFTIFLLAGCFLCINSIAQKPEPEKKTEGPGQEIVPKKHKKGVFFATPFYEYAYYDKLKLISNTNYYTLGDKSKSDEFTDTEITEYNDHYGTAYHYSMIGVKLGYQFLNGLGVSAYVGLNHFTFNSWISPENTQTVSADYPAFTAGLAADYLKFIKEKWGVMAIVSYNYCTTRSVDVRNTSGLDVVSSQLESMYWELNLAAGYRIKKFFPFAGAGITQQFVHPITTEEQIIVDENGVSSTETTKIDSHFAGTSIYMFAGAEYFFTKKISVFARSSFINPFRVNVGLRTTF